MPSNQFSVRNGDVRLRIFHLAPRSQTYHRLTSTSASVAWVSGLSGARAGIGTIVAFKLIGYSSDARQAARTHVFDPIMIVAGLVPFVGMILVLVLVRNTKATDQGLVRRIRTVCVASASAAKIPDAKLFAFWQETKRHYSAGCTINRGGKCEQLGNKNQSEDVLVQLRSVDCRRISLR